MIVVSAEIDFADRKARDQAVQDSAVLQARTRDDEEGCLTYCFAADPVVESRIQVYELWTDGPALAEHLRHPNYLGMREMLGGAGIVASENRAYLVEREESIYTGQGEPRTEFFGQG